MEFPPFRVYTFAAFRENTFSTNTERSASEKNRGKACLQYNQMFCSRDITVMSQDIRLALRIRHLRWRITPEDAARYERHQKRTEGGANIIFLAYNRSWK